ncbi:MAG: hypothetical protein WBX25_15620 [Rhodomicrobium sp.]
MSEQYTDTSARSADGGLTSEADKDAVVAGIIRRLTESWSVTEEAGVSLPESGDFYPPSRPRRGCEDC